MLKLGSTNINKLHLGGTEIKKAYLGTQLVFDNTLLYNDVSVMYTLRRPLMNTLWTNAIAKIRRSSDNQTAFLFIDGSIIDDTISLSSFISTSSNTTPSATTLGTWVGANDAFVEEWIGITPDNTINTNKTAIQTTTTQQPKLISSGVIITKNSKPAIDFLSDSRFLKASANIDINYGNAFAVLTVHNQINTTIEQRVLGTTSGTDDRLLMVADRRTNKHLSVGANAIHGNKVLEYLAQQNHSDQKLLSIIVDNTYFEAFYNGVSQDSSASLNSYINDIFEIGAARSGLRSLEGTIQEIIIFPSDKTSGLTALHNDIGVYYSIL